MSIVRNLSSEVAVLADILLCKYAGYFNHWEPRAYIISSFISASLTFRPEVFKTGCSLYGISDISLIAQESHKFELRYVGKYSRMAYI
jgi:hypothetical protein